MDNLTTETTQATADTAGAEKVNAAAELGKFKDVKALMDAYTNLEAEFTRRSQRLKELENASKEKAPPVNAASGSAPSQGQEAFKNEALTEEVTKEASAKEALTGENLLQAALKSEEVKNAVIGEYLRSVSSGKGVPLVTGGLNVPAQRRSPSTVKEAGRLAQQFLNKREN